MFGRLNAKLAHLKATSQRAQTNDSSAGLVPASTEEQQHQQQHSAHSTPASGSRAQSANTTRPSSPLSTPVSSFHAARVAASHAPKHEIPSTSTIPVPLASGTQQPEQRPTAIADTAALRSYHLYVETPLENAYPPLLSPTSSAISVGASSNKRRLSSPRIDSHSSVLAVESSHLRQPKQTKFEPEHSSTEQLYSPLLTHNPTSFANNQLHLHQGIPVADSSNIGINISGISHINYQQQQHQQQHMQQKMYSQPLPPTPQDFSSPPSARDQQIYQNQPLPRPPGNASPAVGMAATSAAIIGTCGSEPPSDGRTLDDFQLLHTLGKLTIQMHTNVDDNARALLCLC
ncbi:hypothetical protein GGI05_003590 [Coemansia sp. RSA 2603]|nr:hypothetical protein GGI05_003590 [Coemansia sp. RSA 2603]